MMKNKIFRILLFPLSACLAVSFSGCSQTPGESSASNKGESSMSGTPNSTTSSSSTVSGGNYENIFTGDSAKPNFTQDEINEQIKAGQQLLQEIRAAAKDLNQSEYVIPPGHYGFNTTAMDVNGVKSGFVLKGIERPDDNPFTIKADGVTFWFKLSGLPCANVTRAFHIVDCANIIVDGLTLDAYTANTMEGKLTQIDKANNRIEIELYPGTLDDEASFSKISTGTENRIVTQKANGDAMPALYNIDNGWGPCSLKFSKVEKSGDNKVWITFETKTLLNTIFKESWQEAYGAAGTLEIGDRICMLYGTCMAIALDNCKQITIQNVNSYIGKGSFWENGGYGNHKWINCHFSPRPGTNRILGHEGNMSQGLRVGSTFDNVYIGLTSDDAINIHGFWSQITSVTGTFIKANFAPVGIQAGDPVEFYDGAGNLVATGKVKTTPTPSYNYNGFLNGSIELEEAPPANATALTVRWPNSECAGWTIKNCTFEGTYQRILIQSGPGTFENNRILDMGSNLALDTNTADYEGGVLRDIVIKNNVFIDSGMHPACPTIKLSFNTNWAGQQSASNITIEDNVFIGSGTSVLNAVNAKNIKISGNISVDPLRYTAIANPVLAYIDTCYYMNAVSGVTISGNYLFEQTSYAQGNKFINPEAGAALSDNAAFIDGEGTISKKARELYKDNKLSAAEIVSQLKQEAAAFS